MGRVEKVEGGLQQEVRKMGSRIRKALEGVEEERRGGRKVTRGLWDEDCAGKKREVRRRLREWRSGKGEGRDYRKEKREYRELCDSKKQEENVKWEREVEEARTEGRVWELVNMERKRGRRINRDISMEEWEEYFRKILGGIKKRVVWGERGVRREGEEEELDKGEVERVIGRLKEGKAMGVDGIPNEVWRYGGEEIKEWVWEICVGIIGYVWKGEGWPEEWKEGVIAPIVKKGKGEKVGDHRGITIMSTMYKIYAALLTERVREEVERGGMIPQNQTGFRRDMGTVDNIYVLNFLLNRQLEKKGGKIIVLFVDLRAAFDSVDRGELIKSMRKKGMREGLIERTEELLRETKCRVRVGGKVGEEFWTVRGLRQGCPLSPVLFNLLIADLEEKMARVKWGGGGGKFRGGKNILVGICG